MPRQTDGEILRRFAPQNDIPHFHMDEVLVFDRSETGLRLIMSDSLLQQGIAEFNRGHFFEAHELWEEAWNEVVGEEKRFYQGLVQLAAGYHKLSLVQYNGARKLLERGNQTLSAFPPDYAGIDLTSLRQAVVDALNALSTKPA